MIVEVAKSVDNEVGDGTTSSVVFAGALLEKAEELIEKKCTSLCYCRWLYFCCRICFETSG